MLSHDWSTLSVASLALLGSVVLFITGVVFIWTLIQGAKTHLSTTPVDLVATFGTWAVVTGATDGIGKAYSMELASRGVNIVLISRTKAKLEHVADEISQRHGVKTRTIVADFSKGPTVYDVIKEELSNIPVGILVNNVGSQYSYPMYLTEVPEQQLWDIININVGATTLMTRLLLPQMQRRGRGAVINVSSGSELQPLPLMTVYAATKTFVRSFSAALRYECQQHNGRIVVQHLAPMFVNTKMNAFSARLQENTLLVPSAEIYARNAVNTLCRADTSAGYWVHGIQTWFVSLAPCWLRTHIGGVMNMTFRREYLEALTNSKSQVMM